MKPSFCAEPLWPAGEAFFWLDWRRGNLGQEGGNRGGDFLLEDFGEFSTFCLTVESSSYKYMRICLCRDVWW